MKHSYVNLIHHVVRSVILLGFTGLITYLIASGEILLYIAPQLVKYVGAAAAGMLLFSAYQLFALIQSFWTRKPIASCQHCHGDAHSHDHSHSHGASASSWKNIFMYSAFILPLLLAVLMPNEAFAGSLASNKGMNLGDGSASVSGMPADLAQLGAIDDPDAKELFQTQDAYNRDYAKLGLLLYHQDVIEMSDQWFIEKLQALNTFPGNFEGKQIKIKGYVYREDGLQQNQFIIGRMAMVHCIADITPYGIIAESTNGDSFEDDEWVTITGTITSTTHNGQAVIKILVQNSEPAEAPTIPYIYPDWDFAKKLT